MTILLSILSAAGGCGFFGALWAFVKWIGAVNDLRDAVNGINKTLSTVVPEIAQLKADVAYLKGRYGEPR